MISIKINLRSVEIPVTKGLVQDNTKQRLFPSCISQGECVVQGYPYILDKKNKYLCNLRMMDLSSLLCPGKLYGHNPFVLLGAC